MKLRSVIADYIAFRQSIGQTFRRRYLLFAFNRAVGAEIEIKDVDHASVLAFLGRPATCYWHDKHSSLMRFYQYAISRGHVRSSPLPKAVPKISPKFVPYIYSREDMRRLLEATSSYRKVHVLLEPHTFRAILLLLYGAGLRISEALSLRMGEVDLSKAVLLIRESKFYKSRLVPIGPHLQQAMRQFAEVRREAGHSAMPGAPFFIGRKGDKLAIHTVQHSFRQLREYAGICLLCQPPGLCLRNRSKRHTAAAKIVYLLGTYQSQLDPEILDDDAGTSAAGLRTIRTICHGGKHQ